MANMELKTFEGKINVRQITLADYDALVALQLKCFPGMKPWTKEQLESQLAIFPAGQICVEYEGKIIGSSSSLVIEFDEYGEKHSWKDISDSGYIRNHDPEGDSLYGIEIMTDPDFRGMKIGRRLYNARKELARRLNLRRIVIGGRVPNYAQYADKMTVHEFIDRVIHKEFYDPVLTFQLANGFVLKRIITDYLSSDEESKGYATLLEWVNLQYMPEPAKKLLASFPVRICVIQYQMRVIKTFEDFAHQCEFFVDIASDYKSDFALFPEIFTLQLVSLVPHERPGLAVRKLAAEFTPQYLDLFHRLAIRYNINIIGGSHFTQEENGDLFNVSYLFKRDGAIASQYKLHIPPNERRWWGVKPGKELHVFKTDRGEIAILNGYDVEFPELGRLATEKGAEIIFVPFCTGERQSYLRVRTCARARAIENQIYVALAGTVGNLPSVENVDINYAQSGIFTPSDFAFARDGIAGECQENSETVVVADVDLEVLRRHRLSGTVQNWKDRRHDLYKIVEIGKAETRC